MSYGQWRPAKPRQPVIDGNNPIVNGLVFDALLAERGGTTAQDLIGRLSGAFSGSPAWKTDYYGASLSFSGASDAVKYTIPTGSKLESLTNMSYECLINMTGTGGGATGYVVAKGVGSFAPYFLISCKTATTLQILVGFATTAGSWTVPITENAWHHVVVVYTLNVSNTPVVYVDGTLATVTVSAAPSGTAPSDATNLNIGNNNSSTRNWAGQIAYVRAWDRLLNQSEVTNLNKNPWCIYRMPGLIGS